MKQYLDLLQNILDNGEFKEDRTGTGTIGIFGPQIEFDLRDGFPLITTKKLHLKSIIHELLWFLKGSTNVKYLQDNGVRIWNEWATEEGELGPVYGYQWRSWPDYNGGYIDQIANMIEQIKVNPNNRRNLTTTWNVAQISEMMLPPCHGIVKHAYVDTKEYLHIKMYQRSVDTFLGLPFNIASYALLLMMLAQVCGLKAGKLILTLGDTHIYKNHIEQVKLQLSREPYPLPKMKINPNVKNIDDFVYEDFQLVDYESHPY
jgi:thymidylate synthase